MQKVPEDARGIGIQISRLDILKKKSRDTSLMSFIINKQSSTFHLSAETNNVNKIESAADANAVPSISGDAVVKDENKQPISSGSDKSIIPEFLKDGRKEISNDTESKQFAQNVTDQKNQETVSVRNTDEKKSQKNVQTHHEHFFKQTKPGISRPTKIEMPPIEEIDMAVLIELPEDIRNEILNDYTSKRNDEQKNVNINQANTSTSSAVKPDFSERNNCDEQNISFSQVDPEFLAALPDDLRHDVQMYCTAKKAENCVKEKKPEIKQSKKIEPNSKTKSVGKNGKTGVKSKKKNVQTAFKTVKITNNTTNVSNNKVNGDAEKSITPHIGRIGSVDSQITVDDTEAILAHKCTISENNGGTNQHQDILIDLVNRLLNLPLEQVDCIILFVMLTFIVDPYVCLSLPPKDLFLESLKNVTAIR